MKTKYLQLLIFIIAFFEVLMLMSVPYWNTFKFFRLEGANWWGVILLCNGFILNAILIEKFKSKIEPSRIFLLVTMGAIVFMLPYILINLPYAALGAANLFNLTLGIMYAFLIAIGESKTIKIGITMIIIIYSIFYIISLHDELIGAFNLY